MEEIKYFSNERNEILEFLSPSYSRVLEIGCGEGLFSAELPETCERWGIEPDPEAAGKASEKLHTVFTGTWDQCREDLPDNYFDMVICNDVIEHMPDHDFFLKTIKEKICADAVICGSLPNVRYIKNMWELLINKDWCYQKTGILDNTHLRFFTERSIVKMFSRHGYKIELMHGVNPINLKPKTPIKIIKYLMMKILGRDTPYLQFGFRVRLIKSG